MTIVASLIKVCGGHHVYTRVVIRLHHAVNGVRKLVLGEFLPKCTNPNDKNAHLTSFLSPGKRVWCNTVQQASCAAAHGEEPQYSAELYPSGRVKLCSAQVTNPWDVCVQQWDRRAPVLSYGKTSEAYGIRCTSRKNGITCIKISGAGKGHGFRVNKNEAVEITP